MKYKRIIATFNSTPWAILQSKLDEMQAFLRLKGGGERIKAKDIAAIEMVKRDRSDSLLAEVRSVDMQAVRRADGVIMSGRIAILPVMGTISQRVGMMEQASGGVSTEEIGATLDNLVADKQVRAIVMAFDSPGGSVLGVSELAAKIRNAAAQKSVIGLADSIAASAAYWLLSQCREINVTPGGMVGSIGVISSHEDFSKALEKEGITVTDITSSKFKGEGSPYAPLSEEARAEMQSKVNAYHAMFVSDIAKGRGISESRVNKDFGQGRMVTAQDAVASGMADRIAILPTVLRRAGAADAGAVAAAEILKIQAKARARAVEISELTA